MKTEEVCRTCLTDEGDFVSIQSVLQNNIIAQMLTDLTSLQIKLYDGLTQSICSECVEETLNAHKFRTKCLQSSHILSQTSTSDNVSLLNIIKEEPRDLEEHVLDIPFEEAENRNSQSDNDGQNLELKIEIDDDDDNCDNRISTYLDEKTEQKNHILFECPICHALFANDNVYERHIKELHIDKLDDPIFRDDRKPLGVIIKEEGGSKAKYKCFKDDFIGNTIVEFRNHLTEHVGEKYITCSDCNFKTTALSLLRTHRKLVHSESKPFSCPDCDHKCKTNGHLIKHSACHSTEKKYKCKLCPMAFKHASGLSGHKKVKHDHACTICHEAFSDSLELKNHMALHAKEKTHACQLCGLSFAHRRTMKTHMALKHESPKDSTEVFKCTNCDYSTAKKALFLIHVKCHGEKKFKCDQCSYQTVKSSALKCHIATHTGEARFFCDECDYKCYNNCSLKMHKKIHTEEKPHPCSICNYTGRTKNALKVHMETHSSYQTYACSNCSYSTNVQNSLRRHVKKMCLTTKKRGRPSSKQIAIPSSSTSDMMKICIKEEYEPVQN